MALRRAQLILAAVISARASGYMFSKLLLEDMGPFTLMGIRFLLAFAVLAVIFHKRFKNLDARIMLAGLSMGLAFFLTMTCELWALKFTSSSNVSFLENIAIVLVPSIMAFLTRVRPTLPTIACASLALAGVGFLTLSSGLSGIGIGEVLGLGSAVFYTAAMVVTDRFAKSGDTLLMGILQVGCIGLLGTICGFAFEDPVLPTSPLQWSYLGALVIVCTGFGFTLQPMLQKHVPASQVGMMCSLSPLVACILGIAVLHESLSIQGAIGAGLILAAILWSALGSREAKDIRTSESPRPTYEKSLSD